MSHKGHKTRKKSNTRELKKAGKIERDFIKSLIKKRTYKNNLDET